MTKNGNSNKISAIWRLTFVLVAFAAFFTSHISAETISRKQAAEIAEMFFNASASRRLAEPQMVWNGRQLTTSRLFAPFYIFNHSKGGYVIISADNKAYPILGFSLTDTFRTDKLSDTEREWLRRYALQIEAIRYDSRIPYDAIAQWNDIQNTIASILNSQYKATDVSITPDEAYEQLEFSLAKGNDITSASGLYTTAQWNDMIAEELVNRGNVVLGLLSPEDVQPVIVHGRQGDYFRLRAGEPNRALMRLFATEYMTDGQYALLDSPPALPDDLEERPFAFYDEEILPMTVEATAKNISGIDAIQDSTPVVESIGDGHFVITFPAEISLAEIYSVSGAKVRAYKYDSLRRVAVDISAEAPGFYVALFHAPDGRTFGIKLMR